MPEPAAARAEHRVDLAESQDQVELLLERGQLRRAARRGPAGRAGPARTRSGRNSCSGGSSRRMVIGLPGIAANRPSKSCCCSGSSSASAARRSGSVRAMIIARIFGWRSAAMNMCSVRHRPMPSAPCSIALSASAGVSALARTPRRRISSAQLEHALEARVAARLHERHVVARDHAGAAVDRDPRAGGDHLVARRGSRGRAGRCRARRRRPRPGGPCRARPAPRARPCRPRRSGCRARRGSPRRRRPR